MKELSKLVDDINCINEKKDKKTGLHIACDRGRNEIVEHLLTFPQIQVNQGDFTGITPLHLACGNGRKEIVKMLIKDKRVDVNQSCILKRAPLYIACLHGREEIVKILLRYGREIDVNQGNNYGRTTLWLACEHGDENIVKILLASGRGIDVTKEGIKEEENWNGKTPAEIVRMRGFNLIADLVDEYEQDPQEVMLRMRKELG